MVVFQPRTAATNDRATGCGSGSDKGGVCRNRAKGKTTAHHGALGGRSGWRPGHSSQWRSLGCKRRRPLSGRPRRRAARPGRIGLGKLHATLFQHRAQAREVVAHDAVHVLPWWKRSTTARSQLPGRKAATAVAALQARGPHVDVVSTGGLLPGLPSPSGLPTGHRLALGSAGSPGGTLVRQAFQ